MKIALIIVASVLGVLLLAFVVLQIMAGDGVVHSDASLEIDRPAKTVFPYFVERELVPKWVPELESSRALDDGPIGEGTRLETKLNIKGRSFEVESVVTAFERDRVFAMHQDSGYTVSDTRYELEPLGEDRVRVRVVSDTKYQGMLRLLAPFEHDAAQAKLERNLEQLREVVEDDHPRGS